MNDMVAECDWKFENVTGISKIWNNRKQQSYFFISNSLNIFGTTN